MRDKKGYARQGATRLVNADLRVQESEGNQIFEIKFFSLIQNLLFKIRLQKEKKKISPDKSNISYKKEGFSFNQQNH